MSVIPDLKKLERENIIKQEDSNAVKAVNELFGRKATADHLYVFITVVSFAEEETFKMTQSDIPKCKEDVDKQLDKFSETYASIAKEYFPKLSDEKVKEFVKEAYILGARKCFRLLKWHMDVKEKYPEAIEGGLEA
jgi:hypothetical protein